MSAPAAAIPLAGEAVVEHGKPPAAWRSVIGTVEGRIGLGLGVLMCVLIVIGPFIAPYPPEKLAVGPPTAPPSAEHLLGTDQLGRDVFSRFLNGGASVLLVPLLAVTLGLILGGALGMFGAYRGGRADQAVTRAFDLVMALPPLLIVLVLIAGLGTSTVVIVATVALVFAPRIGRIARGATQPFISSEFVAAAQLRDESTMWILRRELLPNVAGPMLAIYALYVTYGVIFVSTLSFLGLGAQPPSSEWGLMVAESRSFFAANPWATLGPAFGIAALSVAFTLTADAVGTHLARGSDRSGGTL